MTQLKFYRANGACSLAPHILLTELGVPFQPIEMNLKDEGFDAKDGSLTIAEYRAKVNPQGFIPVLELDNGLISEMPAVLTYIASLAPERGLTGADGFQRAKVLEWLAWLSNSVHGMGYGMLFRPRRFTDDESLHEVIRQRGRGLLKTFYTRIDKALEGKTFAVGDAETLVDYNLLVFWYWGEKMEFNMVENYPNYSRLTETMESKESVRKTVLVEGKQLAFAKS